MAPVTPRLKILSVGGNAVSAYLSWRLSATNACDVTLVWKAGFEHVSQYGISFESASHGNERFRPRRVVRTPEEAAGPKDGPFDYVILCIKALPDVYDLAAIIDSVVTPQHTCILINTTHSLGVESAIEERFPTNVVLSLVSGAELTQLGQSQFEHKGSADVWVGPANKNSSIPASIQDDMAQALAMTLSTGNVQCTVSPNIRQQQYERVIGPIAFHPASVLFETSDHAALLQKTGVKDVVYGIIDELLVLAQAQGCTLPGDFKDKTIEEMTRPTTTQSIMYQDFTKGRPMEVETYLGSPVKLAEQTGVQVPRIETMYACLFDKNLTNQEKVKNGVSAPAPPGSPGPAPMSRMTSMQSLAPSQAGGPPGPPGPNGPNGPSRRTRGPPSMSGPPPSSMRRPPMNGPPPNGHGRPPMQGGPNGYGPPRQPSRRGSMEGADLEEFSHILQFDEIPEAPGIPGGPGGPGGPMGPGGPGGYPTDGDALRGREMQLREREMALREREMRASRRPPPPRFRRGPSSVRQGPASVYDDDEEEGEDYFDPGPPQAMVDPDNFDMMSVTSRRSRKNVMSQSQIRKNPEMEPPPSRSSRFRPSFGRNRSSQIVSQTPGLHDNILEDPLMAFSSDRYGDVDRGRLHNESRTNSLTASRLDSMQYPPGGPPPMAMNGGGMPGGYPRRASHSPGNPYSPSMRGGQGKPSPPGGPRQPGPRHPNGGHSSVAPHQADQHVGVSTLKPPETKNARSLTGSASASAGSGDSTNLDTPSAHSSQSSLGPRAPVGVR